RAIGAHRSGRTRGPDAVRLAANLARGAGCPQEPGQEHAVHRLRTCRTSANDDRCRQRGVSAVVRLLAIAAAFAVAGCGTISRTESPPVPAPAAAAPAKGAYYKDDGPGANAPANLAAIPDAVPKAEPLNRFANRPYQALGRDYVPMTQPAQFRQSGVGSWYGRRYHGAKTSSGEIYDMYAMTAAHPTLPIPSYVRVTNPANGRSVVLRVNDRGPFLADRVIDLS